VVPVPPPRYDQVYAQGLEWLDKQAGEALQPIKGERQF
jgi:hypothetical protein